MQILVHEYGSARVADKKHNHCALENFGESSSKIKVPWSQQRAKSLHDRPMIGIKSMTGNSETD